jgi:hypothetical protein
MVSQGGYFLWHLLFRFDVGENTNIGDPGR